MVKMVLKVGTFMLPSRSRWSDRKATNQPNN